ncbi:hypothetical protein [Lentzea sp. NPDC055074]
MAWGEQVDVRQSRASNANQVEENGEISESRLAAYVAEYATKGTARAKLRTSSFGPSWTSSCCGCPKTTAG